VAPSTNSDGEAIFTGKSDGTSDVGGCADESDEFWVALRVGCPACDGEEIVGVGVTRSPAKLDLKSVKSDILRPRVVS